MSRRMRHKRVRRKVSGTSSSPRLCIFRSLNHIYAQIIDDSKGQTLVSMSTLDPHFHVTANQSLDSEPKPRAKRGGSKKEEAVKNVIAGEAKQAHEMNKSKKAEAIGSLLAEKALSKGIKRVVFDRGGYKYHGRVKALAEAVRQVGLSF